MPDQTVSADISRETEGDGFFQVREEDARLAPDVITDGLELSTFKVSTTFNYGYLDADGAPPDYTAISSDDVHFAVITSKLLAASTNNFGNLLVASDLPSSNSLSPSSLTAVAGIVPLTAVALNLLLHTVYGLSVAKYTPAMKDLAAAVEALGLFGLSKETYMNNTSPLFQAILSRASSMPLECYKLAAHAGIEELAVLTSRPTLRLSLTDITDEDVREMGAHYTRRLFFLHLGRVDALKRILLSPPDSHARSSSCGPEQQGRLSRAWAMMVAETMWDFKPNMSDITLDVRTRAIGRGIECQECVQQLDHRIKRLLTEWALVKQTI